MHAERCSQTDAWRRLWIGGIVILLGLTAGLGETGCQWTGLGSPSVLTVPCTWRLHHPWGPQANQARAQGQMALLHYTPKMTCWAEFGRHYLQPGDVVLRRGRASCPTALLGSSLISSLCDSPFSHEGLVCFEDGHPWVYDMAEEGTRKMPFEVWMLDTVNDTLAIKRLKPAFRDRIPGIVGFCETAYQCEVPFDYAMTLDDDRYYCTELVEKAFASASLPLSRAGPDPVPPWFSEMSVVYPNGPTPHRHPPGRTCVQPGQCLLRHLQLALARPRLPGRGIHQSLAEQQAPVLFQTRRMKKTYFSPRIFILVPRAG